MTNTPEQPETPSRVSVRSAEVDVPISAEKLDEFIECVKRTGKVTLTIRHAGATPIPPEVLSVVDATN